MLALALSIVVMARTTIYVRDDVHDDVHGNDVRADEKYFHNFHSPHADHLRDHAHSSNIHLHTPPLAFQEIQLRL